MGHSPTSVTSILHTEGYPFQAFIQCAASMLQSTASPRGYDLAWLKITDLIDRVSNGANI
jgi:hypothetical protein